MDEYESVQTSVLKLKGVAESGIKKKKKKKKSKEKEKKKREQILSGQGGEGGSAQGEPGQGEPGQGESTSQGETSGEVRPTTSWRDKRTKAEIAFERATAKRNAQQIIEKASKTHKERIMEFNQHLDSLTEHFDIPKVSWTK